MRELHWQILDEKGQAVAEKQDHGAVSYGAETRHSIWWISFLKNYNPDSRYLLNFDTYSLFCTPMM